jgi:mRNA interferase HigB
MHVITGGTLEDYWERPGRKEAEQPLKSWYAEARQATWKGPADVRAAYGSAAMLPGGLVSFAFCGGGHRLVAVVNYGVGVVLVRFVGTDEEFAAAWGRAAA